MFLKEVRLYNWRKFRMEENNEPGLIVNFKKGLNILIGENDSGKTSIIDAIRLTLGTNSGVLERVSEEDFSNGTEKLRIECIFDGLSNKEEAYFLEWLTLTGEKLDQSSLRIVYKANKYKDGNNIEKISRELVAGPKNQEQTMHSIAQEYLRVTFLKPLRDAENELKPGYRSRVAKVIEGLEAFQEEESKKAIVERFENVFDTLDEELQAPVLDKINNHLRSFLSETDRRSAQVQKKTLSFLDVLRRLELNYNDIKSGLGSTNILFMALELLALREHDIGTQLTLIEEIEAHLHPQAQLRVIKSFEKYIDDNPSLNAQYILTTHSPTLASSIKLENLIMIFGSKVYPMRKPYTKLKHEDYGFLNRFLDATKANLFFAKGVILVEGYSESIIVSAIAEAIGKPLHDYGVSIVNVQGIQFNRYIPIFLRKEGIMNFPVSLITDMDISPESHYISKDECSYEEIKVPVTMQQIKSDRSIKWTNNLVEEHFKIWDYTEEQVNLILDEVEKRKKGEYYHGKEKIKVYLASPWTLEHSIGKSILKEDFEKIIVQLREYKNEDTAEKKLNEWKNIDNIHERAVSTYKFVLNNSISKPIIAQELSEKILQFPDEKKKELIVDKSLRYIIDAILHVTDGDSNEEN